MSSTPARPSMADRLKLVEASGDDMFFPKATVTVKYGDYSLKAYPKVDSSHRPCEIIFAMLSNRSQAEAQHFHPAQTLDFTASRCGMEVNARVAQAQWTSRVTDMWADPSKLTVLSYHTSLGTIIADAIDPATGAICPITDGTVGTRRPADVAFAKVRLKIDFQELHYKNDPCTARFTYFIRCRQC